MRRWFPGSFWLSAAALLLLGCREPTQITVELSTDIDCSDRPRTGISVGTLADLEQRPMSTETRRCDAATGRIGSIVVVPGGEKDDEVAVRVVTGITMSADDCVRQGYKGGCVVARRALAFRPAEPLYLPITIEASCIDVPCEATQTCRSGACVSATIQDPNTCASAAGCDVAAPSHLGGSGGLGSGGAESTGGQLSSGGTAPTVGVSAAGGSVLGGTSGGGNAPTIGGMLSSAGMTSAGGYAELGGVSNGGAEAMGGAPATGGVSATAGSVATGGVSAFGGVSATGGVSVIVGTANGGTSASGGVTSVAMGAAGSGGFGGSNSSGGAAGNTGGVAGSTSTGGASIAGNMAGAAGAAGVAGGNNGVHTIVVTTVSDVSDGAVTSLEALSANRGPDGKVSLREALTACNNTPNYLKPDVVNFDIPGTGPHTIAVGASPLPTITDAVILDGGSEPDYTGAPIIDLDGTNVLTGWGLYFSAGSDGSKLRCFVLRGFPESGLLVDISGNHTIQNNYVGLRLDGTRHANAKFGIHISNSANNMIGGSVLPNARERNVVSGNGLQGILISGPDAHHNVVSGNLVGTDPSATIARPNALNGIFIGSGASFNTIGGVSSNLRNIISGNGGNGIRITDATTHGNVVQNNNIGTDFVFSGLSTLGNAWAGIRILGGAHDNLIGGDSVLLANRIRFNALGAILINGGDPQNNAILSNMIYDNPGLGIDLGGDAAATPNDALDVDTGPNDLLNYPEFVNASYTAGEVTIDYILDVPAGSYRIEFFCNSAANPSGHGNGERFAHAELIVHGGTGEEPFSARFLCDAAEVITATATEVVSANAYGSTSEFSMAIPTTY